MVVYFLLHSVDMAVLIYFSVAGVCVGILCQRGTCVKKPKQPLKVKNSP